MDSGEDNGDGDDSDGDDDIDGDDIDGDDDSDGDSDDDIDGDDSDGDSDGEMIVMMVICDGDDDVVNVMWGSVTGDDQLDRVKNV